MNGEIVLVPVNVHRHFVQVVALFRLLRQARTCPNRIHLLENQVDSRFGHPHGGAAGVEFFGANTTAVPLWLVFDLFRLIGFRRVVRIPSPLDLFVPLPGRPALSGEARCQVCVSDRRNPGDDRRDLMLPAIQPGSAWRP